MPHAFGTALAEARGAQGFKTPYAFYTARDGRRLLGLSFANYLRIEKGRSLPKPFRLLRLVGALGFSSGEPRAKALIRAYIKSVLGSDELLEAREAAAPDPAPASWLLAENATRQAIGQRAIQLSMEQYRVLAKDPTAYAAHALVCNTHGGLETKELARMLKVSAAALRAALSALCKAGLATKRGTVIESPFAGKFVTPPTPTPELAGVFAALAKHRAAWLESRARVLDAPYLILRAPKAKMRQYLAHLGDAVRLSAVYGDVKPGEDSEFYLVEGRVMRLFE